jgi:hypothetical protein
LAPQCCYQKSSIPADLLRVGDPVEEIGDPEHGFLGDGHQLVLKKRERIVEICGFRGLNEML